MLPAAALPGQVSPTQTHATAQQAGALSSTVSFEQALLAVVAGLAVRVGFRPKGHRWEVQRQDPPTR